jgi:hypothetical protein
MDVLVAKLSDVGPGLAVGSTTGGLQALKTTTMSSKNAILIFLVI